MLSRRALLMTAAMTAWTVTSPMPGHAQEQRLPVVASFSILGDIVQNVGGDRIRLITLVQPGSDAHVYKPTPADAKAVAEARLVVTNGLRFEGWMRRLVQASSSKATVIEAARGIKELVETKQDSHGHAHGKKDKHGHDHGGLDPHAWQSVSNVKIYVANIRDALIAADPAGKEHYSANAARYTAELDAVDADIRAVIARIPADRRRVVTSHDAFGYFQRDYGIEFRSPLGVSTEAEASAQAVGRLIQQIRREKIAAVFIETISDGRLIERIAKESGAKVGGTLYSDALSKADGPAATYISMMKHNIRTISSALLPAS